MRLFIAVLVSLGGLLGCTDHAPAATYPPNTVIVRPTEPVDPNEASRGDSVSILATATEAEFVQPDSLAIATLNDALIHGAPADSTVVVERENQTSLTTNENDWPEPHPTVSRPDVMINAVPTPNPVVSEIWDGGPSSYGFTSLEHRIFASDAVVVARLRSINPKGVLFYCGSSEVGGWIPVIELGFEVIDYLKGEGDDKLSVNLSFGWWGNSYSSVRTTYLNESDAELAAEIAIHEGYFDFDEGEAVLFVANDERYTRCIEGQGAENIAFSFALSGHPQSQDFIINSEYNRVWLPAVESVASEESIISKVKRFKLSPESTIETTRDTEFGRSGTITVGEIIHRVDLLERSIDAAQEEGIAGYADCLESKFDREKRNLAARESGGEIRFHWWSHEVGPFDRQVMVYSGVSAVNTAFGSAWEVKETGGSDSSNDGDSDGDAIWLSGENADLFELVSVSEFLEGRELVENFIAARRVLPEGMYSVELNQQEARFRPCGYYDESTRTTFEVQVIAPNDVLLEAFYDPVGVGIDLDASGVEGTLSPNSFELNGNEIEIDRLLWREGGLSLTSRGAVAIDALALEFIGNDGKTVLELDGDGASLEKSGDSGVQAHHWDIDVIPWNAGDKMMLRIWDSEKADADHRRQVKTYTPTCAFNVVEALGNGTYDVDVEWPYHNCRGTGTAGVLDSAVRYVVVRIDEPGVVRVDTRYECAGTRWWVRSGIGIDGQLVREISETDDLDRYDDFTFDVRHTGHYTIEMNAVIPDLCVVRWFSVSLR